LTAPEENKKKVELLEGYAGAYIPDSIPAFEVIGLASSLRGLVIV
jgi:hypothetical protein